MTKKIVFERRDRKRILIPSSSGKTVGNRFLLKSQVHGLRSFSISTISLIYFVSGLLISPHIAKANWWNTRGTTFDLIHFFCSPSVSTKKMFFFILSLILIFLGMVMLLYG